MSATSLKVLLVDDHAVVRQGLRAYLELQPGIEVCAEADSTRQAAEQALRCQPDVALVDLVLPDEDGIQATRRIRSVSPRTQVLVLTSSLGLDEVQLAFDAGASGYQLKEIGGAELLDSLWRVARGERVLHPRLGASAPQPRSRNEFTTSAVAALSAREREVLLLLAEGLSNTEITERLQIGEATVKTHVGNVLGKLGLSDRTQAAVWAWRQGLAR
ncbi:response regulator transcription factor [Xanthomonadaceae bacterium JHOS43]|nr:response regulator transcription factor [Xanthomonadaceae bacterium JHOS43]